MIRKKKRVPKIDTTKHGAVDGMTPEQEEATGFTSNSRPMRAYERSSARIGMFSESSELSTADISTARRIRLSEIELIEESILRTEADLAARRNKVQRLYEEVAGLDDVILLRR